MRRLVLSLGVLGVSAGIARLPLDLHSSIGRYADDARESRAFVLAGAPIRFDVPAGRERLRILTNLDLPSNVPPEGIDYGVRVRFSSTGREETYGLRAKPAPRDGDEPRVFYMGDGAIPAATREIALFVPPQGPTSIELSLVWPGKPQGPGTASLRVMLPETRPPLAGGFLEKRLGDEGRENLAAALGPLAWSELSEAGRELALSQRWVRLGAATESRSRRLYTLDRPLSPSPSTRMPGELVGPDRVLAYTVRGPGSIRFAVLEGHLKGAIDTLNEDARTSTLPVSLRAGQDLSVPVEGKLLTLRITSTMAAHLQALVSSPDMALLPAPGMAPPAQELRLSPPSLYEHAAIVRQRSAVVYDLRGRGKAELHVVARALLRPSEEKPASRMTWRVLDDARQTVAQGEFELTKDMAREDGVDGDEVSRLGEPSGVYLWPPETGAQLELGADGQAAVTASSPGFAVDPTAARNLDLSPDLRVRHDMPEVRGWFPLRPANLDDLGKAGLLARLRLPIRLEPRPLPPPPPAQAESLEPTGPASRFDLLLPAKGISSSGRGNYWTIPSGKDVSVAVRALQGLPRVPGTVIYAGEQAVSGQTLVVGIDDGHPIRRALYSSRGKLPLPDLAQGRHRIRMDLQRGARLFVSWPVEGGTVYRATAAYAVRRDRPLRVPLCKGTHPRSLGVQLFSDSPPAANAELYATVDGGRRRARPGTVSTGWTILKRSLPVSGAYLPGAMFLNRKSERLWASEPIFIPLQDDLRPGAHSISVAVKGAHAPAFVRFFSYSPGRQRDRFSHLARLHVESSP